MDSTNNVDVVASIQHANAYFEYLLKRKQSGSIGTEYAKKLFITFKSFVGYLVEEGVLHTVPSWLNLKKRFVMRADKRSPQPISLDHMRRIYEAAPERVRLYMLLMLNCGFGQGEIGRLKYSEYDSVAGTITHRRKKTEKCPNTPEVTYRLWSRTKIILDDQLKQQKKYRKLPEHDQLLLVNTAGTPLWREWYSDGKSHKIDCIAPLFEKVVENIQKIDSSFPAHRFYKLRSTSATVIFSKEEFRHLDWLWLGHAPRSMSKERYVKISSDILDACLEWLGKELFGDE